MPVAPATVVTVPTAGPINCSEAATVLLDPSVIEAIDWGGPRVKAPSAGGAQGCFDSPGAQLTASTTWTKYQVPFASLVQLGFGNKSPVGSDFPKNKIINFKWDIGIPQTGPTGAWDIWVDDLTFY